MPDSEDDPTMPKRPPTAALRAIARFRDYRGWEQVDLYRDLREALQGPHEYPPDRGMPDTGEPPRQG